MARKPPNTRPPSTSQPSGKLTPAELALQQYAQRTNEAWQTMSQRSQEARSNYARALVERRAGHARGEAAEAVHRAYLDHFLALQAAGAAGWTPEASEKVKEAHTRHVEAYKAVVTAGEELGKGCWELYTNLVGELQAILAEAQGNQEAAYHAFLASQQEAWAGLDPSALSPAELLALARGLANVAAHAQVSQLSRRPAAPAAEKSNAPE
ncbi:MAG TPA: hypothetical protein VEI03_04710 [Stellaceae bacterium]|nr:hypothetical protein [Stellaceae bacterium]